MFDEYSHGRYYISIIKGRRKWYKKAYNEDKVKFFVKKHI